MPKSCAVNFPLTNVTQKLNYHLKFEYQFKQVAYSEQPITERPIQAIKYTKTCISKPGQFISVCLT